MLTAASLTFIVPAVGLAIDASMIYGVRARLSAAADAGALAAARSLSSGLTIGEQETSAIDTASRFFHANFPNNYLASTNKTFSAAVAETGARTRTVTVDVAVDAPSYFLRYIGRTSTHIRAIGKASRRDVNVMIVLDRSGSLSTSGACTPVKNAATAFVQKFANYRDRVGLLTFGGDYNVDFPMQTTPGNFLSGSGSIPDKISLINCVGATNSAQALWNGYGELKRINEAGSLNAIVFFTDGQANTATFDFTDAVRTVARGYTGAAPTSSSGITATSRTPCATTTGKIGWVQGDTRTFARLGVYKYTTTALPATSSPQISDRTGCAFKEIGAAYSHGDFGFIPPQDIYGNNVETGGYKTLTHITASTSPDLGKIRLDLTSNIENAGINAATHAARRIRSNETAAQQLNPVIYSIGLGGVGAAEDEFLKRVANTSDSPEHNASQQQGIYVYAPTIADLNEAFARIAGEILRIAR